MAPKRPDQVIEELYPSVMKEVIEASIVDFEDAGVSLDVLYELKSLWEKNLTNAKVGHFPWDPVIPISVPIKLEPNDTPSLVPFNSAVIQERRSEQQELTALQHHNAARLKNTLGQGGSQWAHGDGSGNILGVPLQQGRHPTNILTGSLTAGLTPLQRYQMQLGASLRDPKVVQQGAQAYVLQQQQRVRPVMTPAAAQAAQAILKRATATSVLPVSNNPQQQQQQQQQTVQNPPNDQSSGSQLVTSRPQEPENDGTVQSPVTHSYTGEGGGGASESPNDADDSSSVDEDEEFEDVPELLVCLYDKVSKTRNKAMHKWRCQLRDGVLVVGEKEYVFVRANAELAW